MDDTQKQLVGKVKTCLSKLGLSVKGESHEDSFIAIDSEFNYADEPMGIRVLLDNDGQTLAIGIAYGIVPKEKRAVIHELISRINVLVVVGKYIMELDTGGLVLQSGACITDDGLSEKEFLALLKRIMADNYEYSRLIGKQLNSTSTPAEIIDNYLKEKDEPCNCLMNLEEKKCTLH
ncbi:MAG TPA: hypothetical protein PKW51_05170 [Methanoregulaceae archaeon]|jgi:hypothetical protein|nr:hypothetical protein [Methanoregulaceae archaeon]